MGLARGNRKAGGKLREWRGARTLEEVAALLKTTRQYVGMLEKGERRPSLETAAELERHTGISPLEWLP